MADEPTGAALVSKSQREYLRGLSDIEPKTTDERGKRQAIRDRLRDAILDFGLIMNCFDTADGEQRPLQPNDERLLAGAIKDDRRLRIGLHRGIALCTRLGVQAGMDYETLVDKGILRSDPDIARVESSIEIDWYEGYVIGTVGEKLRNNEIPDPWEIGMAVMNGELNDTERDKIRELNVPTSVPQPGEGAHDWDDL